MNQRNHLRVLFYLSLTAVGAGAALSSWRLLRVMNGFTNAEASGLLSVGGGIAEANQPLIVALYFGIACGLIAIISSVRSRSAPAWFRLSAACLAFVPLVIFWVAETLLLDSLRSARDGVIANATLIQRLLFLARSSGALLSVLFFFASIHVSPKVARKRTVAAVCLLAGSFVLAAIAFHLRNAWIYGLKTL
ncbi:MAG TPA: hypothetical protein VJS64_12290 [Pyrinomonadaceae bacterium]|nr:hypothetical protein [Pyrinomonadaceae bacterium]